MDLDKQRPVKGVSVVICCYNSGNKLVETLTHLAGQLRWPGVEYELLIVDNNCTDNTVDIALETWTALKSPFSQRVIQEKSSGLNFAREAGIYSASYEYIVLCDDDNWLCEYYLKTVHTLFEEMPEVAVVGGVGEAIAAIPLPGWFKEVNGFGYAVGKEGRSTGYVESVYGAGMALRKTVFNEMLNSRKLILTDRRANELSSGGDTEICAVVKEAGYSIYMDERLTFKHFLSAERLQWKYYLKLRRSFGEANAMLQMKHNILPAGSVFKARLSIVVFAMRHFKYLLLPSFYKEKDNAWFVQEIARKLTLAKTQPPVL